MLHCATLISSWVNHIDLENKRDEELFSVIQTGIVTNNIILFLTTANVIILDINTNNTNIVKTNMLNNTSVSEFKNKIYYVH